VAEHSTFDILLVRPRGFCAGVERAIDIVDLALGRHGAPVYVRREIVHNQTVVERLRERGAIFVEELDEVPDGGLCIFSAHGVAPTVFAEAQRRGLRVIDATCPLVTKVHLEVHRAVDEGSTVILIGHAGHDEVIGTLGQRPPHMLLVEDVEQARAIEIPGEQPLYYVTQTTLSVDETREIVDVLKQRFPRLRGPRKDDICYATQNRQDAVKFLVTERDVDRLLVVGSENSSNSRRLVEVARERGVQALLLDSHRQLEDAWLDGARRVGVTAGASAPEDLVEDLVAALVERGGSLVEENHILEDVHFPLPAELRTTPEAAD